MSHITDIYDRESHRHDFWTWPVTYRSITSKFVKKHVFNETSAFTFEVDLMAEQMHLSVGDV